MRMCQTLFNQSPMNGYLFRLLLVVYSYNNLALSVPYRSFRSHVVYLCTFAGEKGMHFNMKHQQGMRTYAKSRPEISSRERNHEGENFDHQQGPRFPGKSVSAHPESGPPPSPALKPQCLGGGAQWRSLCTAVPFLISFPTASSAAKTDFHNLLSLQYVVQI